MEDEPTVPVPPAQPGGVETPPIPTAAVSVPPPAGPWTPPPSYSSPNRFVRALGHRATGWFVAALMVGVITGLSVALSNAPSNVAPLAYSAPQQVVPPSIQIPKVPNKRVFTVPAFPQTPLHFFGAASVGRVDSVGSTSFTMISAGGSKVTVGEQSTTTYQSFGGAVGKSALKKGVSVAVIGSRSGSTVKAARVFVLGGPLGRVRLYVP